MERMERKRLKQEENDKRLKALLSLVKNKAFVMEASTLRGKYSYSHQVSPNTNFIKIENDEVTVQTAGGFNPGYNGLGGITLNGKITDYEILSDEGETNISVLVYFTTPVLGASTLNLNIQPEGFANANITTNWGGRASFHGRVFGLEDNQVYEGMSIM